MELSRDQALQKVHESNNTEIEASYPEDFTILGAQAVAIHLLPTGHEGLLEGAGLEAAGREGVLGGLTGEVGEAALRGGERLRGQGQHQRRASLRSAHTGAGGHDDRPRRADVSGTLAWGSKRPRGSGAQRRRRHLISSSER